MPALDEQAARSRFSAARVARLATVTPDGRPHVVPVTFALVTASGGDRIVTAVDRKPKTTLQLQRLRNVAAHPRVGLLVDHYAEDWSTLWWVRADGDARVVHRSDDDAAHRAAVGLLVDRYPAYREEPPAGPVLVVAVTRWTGWAASHDMTSP